MQSSGLESSKNVAYFEYDFSKHGGAIGDITVQGDSIPAGAVVNQGAIHAKAAVTGGSGATLAITGLTAGDIRAAAVVTGLTLNSLSSPVVVPQTASTWFRTTSNLNSLTFTVAVAALTAGKVVVALEYFITEE